MSEATELPINTAQVVDSSNVSDHHAIIPTLNTKGLSVRSYASLCSVDTLER